MELRSAQLAAALESARRAPFYASHAALLDQLDQLDRRDRLTPADLALLPFTTKDDFRADYARFLTGEPAARLHTTSGSTGRPAYVLYSVHELMAITRRAMDTMRLAGVGSTDRVLNLFGYGTFIAGNLYDWGATALGALVIPFGSATMTPPAFAAETLKSLRPTVVSGVPSYLLRFLGDLRREEAGAGAVDGIRVLACAGEVLTPALRSRLASVAPAAGIFDQYGMTEFGPLAAQCAVRDGMHLLADGLWCEVVDPAGRPVDEGEGELVVTSLENQAMALLRYRTGDQVLVLAGACPCGRAGRRIRVLRRADDLLKIRGVLCAKNDLADAVRAVAGGAPFKIRIYRDENEVDRLAVEVAHPDGNGAATAFAAGLRAAVKSRCRLGVDHVAVLPAIEMPRTVSGKALYVLDERRAQAQGEHSC